MCTSRSEMHSSQALNRRFIFLMATVSPVARLTAFQTVPYVPSPNCRVTLYLQPHARRDLGECKAHKAASLLKCSMDIDSVYKAAILMCLRY